MYMKKDKGITIIALVITIIVLLILAGITIATLMGENGIIARASKSRAENEKAEILEGVRLYVNEWAIEKNTPKATNFETFLRGKYNATKNENGTYSVVDKGYEIIIDLENGTVTTNDNEIEISESNIPINTEYQFKKIGSGETVKVNNDFYKFTSDAIYEVKNDLIVEHNGVFEPNINKEDGGRINTYENVVTIKNTTDNTTRYYQNQVFVTKDNAIEEGLILHYDSVNNTGTGYDSATTIWKDLQGNNDATLQGRSYLE